MIIAVTVTPFACNSNEKKAGICYKFWSILWAKLYKNWIRVLLGLGRIYLFITWDSQNRKSISLSWHMFSSMCVLLKVVLSSNRKLIAWVLVKDTEEKETKSVKQVAQDKDTPFRFGHTGFQRSLHRSAAIGCPWSSRSLKSPWDPHLLVNKVFDSIF